MRLWWRRYGDVQTDLQEAKRERKKAELEANHTRQRWHEVGRIIRESQKIRRDNHLADDLRAIFRE